MKGYVSTHDGKDNFKRIIYKIGKTYKFDGFLFDAFHFYKNIEELLVYSKPKKGFKVYEVEVLGEIHNGVISFVTNKLKVIGEANINDMVEYDDNGNIIRFLYKRYYWCQKFDKKGNLIYFADDYNEERYTYDEGGNCINYKYSGDIYCEHWKTFDQNGNCISYLSANGYKINSQYDSNNNLTYTKDSKDSEWWYTYDENGNCIYRFNKSKNGLLEQWHTYDNNNNCVYYRDSKDYKKWYTYDEKNNLIGFKDSNGESWNIIIE